MIQSLFLRVTADRKESSTSHKILGSRALRISNFSPRNRSSRRRGRWNRLRARQYRQVNKDIRKSTLIMGVMCIETARVEDTVCPLVTDLVQIRPAGDPGPAKPLPHLP